VKRPTVLRGVKRWEYARAPLSRAEAERWLGARRSVARVKAEHGTYRRPRGALLIRVPAAAEVAAHLQEPPPLDCVDFPIFSQASLFSVKG
jgi:hypothetical protein